MHPNLIPGGFVGDFFTLRSLARSQAGNDSLSSLTARQREIFRQFCVSQGYELNSMPWFQLLSEGALA